MKRIVATPGSGRGPAAEKWTVLAAIAFMGVLAALAWLQPQAAPPILNTTGGPRVSVPSHTASPWEDTVPTHTPSGGI